jgi:hypothetical protein
MPATAICRQSRALCVTFGTSVPNWCMVASLWSLGRKLQSLRADCIYPVLLTTRKLHRLVKGIPAVRSGACLHATGLYRLQSPVSHNLDKAGL